jgi:hypothetical protein
VPTIPGPGGVLPTRAGEPRVLVDGGFEQILTARWTPDGRGVVVVGNLPGMEQQSFRVDASGGPAVAITPEGVRGSAVTPDGTAIAALDLHTKRWALYPLAGGPPSPINGLADDEVPLRWGADGKTLFARATTQFPVKVTRITLATGRRETVAEIKPADPTGVKPYPRSIAVAPDGSGYAFSYMRSASELYLLEGCSNWCLTSGTM